MTYHELYYLQAATRITQKNVALLASFKELARVNFEGGRARFADVLRVEIEEEALQNKLQYLEESHLPLITEFEQLLNQNITEPLDLPDSLWQEELTLSKDSIFRVMLVNNPRLEELRYKAQVHESEVIVAHKMGLPSFTLGGSYINVAARPDSEITGMSVPDNGQDVVMLPQVGVRLPLYRKKYRAMEKQAQLRQKAVRLREESTEDQLAHRTGSFVS